MMNKIIDRAHVTVISSFAADGYVVVKTVLVEDPEKKYCAYTGIGNDNFVAIAGDKLTFKDAKAKFPQIKKNLYKD